MIGWLHGLGIRTRVFLLAAAMTIGMGANGAATLMNLHTSMLDERKERIRNLTDSAYAIVEYYYGLQTHGKLPQSEAKNLSREAIRGMRFAETGYFFIIDVDYHQVLMPPQRELEGVDRKATRDASGKLFVKDMIDMVTVAKSGFSSYQYAKPGESRAVDKISYVKLFEPWGWAVGTGIYLDDFGNAVFASAILSLVILLAVLVIIVGLAGLIGRSIVGQLGGEPAYAISLARGIAAGKLSAQITLEKTDSRSLLHAMSEMQKVLLRVMHNIKEVVAAAAQGDFSRRVDEAGMQGFQMEIAHNVNTLVVTSEQGLTDLSRVLGALARGDLTQSMDKDHQGLFGSLKDDANQTAAQLGRIVVRIKDSADAIHVASKEIASGNADLSQRTEEQAGSLEQTASSMEELTSTVKQNAENAKQAHQLAIGASEIAARGGQVVAEVVSTMDGITKSSYKIADIVGVIDGIAFQTNILALNAAVEAARAGEQGRGFAVVATEVRNLAQRSAAAAKEIKTLIGESVAKVEAGSRQVNDAGKTMGEILSSVKRVTDIMAEITAASAEQSSGIAQVSSAVAQMDAVTQQNAALVEQAAAAAESLREEAAKLVQSTLLFKLEGHGAFLERTRTAAAELIRQFPEGIQSDRSAAKTEHGMKLPGLRSGTRVISGDEHMVDRLQERLGVAATIFACDGGEFVRVSTSVRDERGKRVLGTRLDASHPAVACLIDKRAYEGSMVLFGQAYMTRYDPIFDSGGSLIGAFFVGVEMSASRPARERARVSVRHEDSARRADARPAGNSVRLDPAAKTASAHRPAARRAGGTAVSALADDQWQEF